MGPGPPAAAAASLPAAAAAGRLRLVDVPRLVKLTQLQQQAKAAGEQSVDQVPYGGTDAQDLS